MKGVWSGIKGLKGMVRNACTQSGIAVSGDGYRSGEPFRSSRKSRDS